MKNEYDFTGIGSASDDGGDFDGLNQTYQHPSGSDPNTMDGLGGLSEACRAVRSEQRGCASHQGGTNFDNMLDELSNREYAPGQLEAEDLVQERYIDEIPGSQASGEYQHRVWNPSDNTGGDGIEQDIMPLVLRKNSTPPIKKPY